MFTFVSGQSKPGSTVGPVLAKNGINIMKFVKEFSAATDDIKVQQVSDTMYITIFNFLSHICI